MDVNEVRKLFPVSVGAAFGPIPAGESCAERITKREAEAVAKAVPKRRREFAACRGFAREALAELGFHIEELPRLDDGRPDWPEGVVGAITHSAEWGAAVVARAGDALGLGIDIERIGRMSEGAARHALSAGELRASEDHEVGTREALWTLKFSAKESIYKCLYQSVMRYICFSEAEITAEPGGRFTAKLDDALLASLPEGCMLLGRYLLFDGHVLTACLLVGR